VGLRDGDAVRQEARLPIEAWCTPDELVDVPHRALAAISARTARRIQPLWRDLNELRQRQLEIAVEITEGVARGVLTHQDARAADGVEVESWSMERPDFSAWRTASGVAIYALACSCCDEPNEAALAAVLTWREALFASVGDSPDVQTAERRVREALSAKEDSPVRRIATAMMDDLDRVRSLAASKQWDDESRVPPEALGPLWPPCTRSPWIV